MPSRSRLNSMLVGAQDLPVETLVAKAFGTTMAQGLVYNANTVTSTVTLPTDVNALWIGKLTVETDGKIIVSTGTRLVIV